MPNIQKLFIKIIDILRVNIDRGSFYSSYFKVSIIFPSFAEYFWWN